MINYLKRALDGAGARQKAISNNIANVNTPGYKRKDVDFLSTLKNKVESDNKTLNLKRTNNQHLTATGNLNSARTKFEITTEQGTSFKNDDNNVDVDVEMTELAKNNIYYNTLTNQINTKFSMLKNVISKGGK